MLQIPQSFLDILWFIVQLKFTIMNVAGLMLMNFNKLYDNVAKFSKFMKIHYLLNSGFINKKCNE